MLCLATPPILRVSFHVSIWVSQIVKEIMRRTQPMRKDVTTLVGLYKDYFPSKASGY